MFKYSFIISKHPPLPTFIFQYRGGFSTSVIIASVHPVFYFSAIWSLLSESVSENQADAYIQLLALNRQVKICKKKRNKNSEKFQGLLLLCFPRNSKEQRKISL